MLFQDVNRYTRVWKRRRLDEITAFNNPWCLGSDGAEMRFSPQLSRSCMQQRREERKRKRKPGEKYLCAFRRVTDFGARQPVASGPI